MPQHEYGSSNTNRGRTWVKWRSLMVWADGYGSHVHTVLLLIATLAPSIPGNLEILDILARTFAMSEQHLQPNDHVHVLFERLERVRRLYIHFRNTGTIIAGSLHRNDRRPSASEVYT